VQLIIFVATIFKLANVNFLTSIFVCDL